MLRLSSRSLIRSISRMTLREREHRSAHTSVGVERREERGERREERGERRARPADRARECARHLPVLHPRLLRRCWSALRCDPSCLTLASVDPYPGPLLSHAFSSVKTFVKRFEVGSFFVDDKVVEVQGRGRDPGRERAVRAEEGRMRVVVLFEQALAGAVRPRPGGRLGEGIRQRADEHPTAAERRPGPGHRETHASKKTNMRANKDDHPHNLTRIPSHLPSHPPLPPSHPTSHPTSYPTSHPIPSDPRTWTWETQACRP